MQGAGVPRFSILTCAYDTPPEILRETAASVFAQSFPDYEWVLLDNGSSRAEARVVLAELAARPRVVALRLEDGLGILGGLRHAFERARGTYVLVLDHDDLLTRDALAAVDQAIVAAGEPPAVYSDESVVEGRTTIAEYRRPDWDPVLNLGSSYVFHLLAFRRELGLQLGVYADRSAEYCQDWDTVWRLASGGVRLEHVPRVLYHWRRHKSSATNKPTPDSGSLRSQRAILERVIAARADRDRFAVVPCPIDRGAPELHVARQHVAPAPIDFVLGSNAPGALARANELASAAGYPFRSVTVAAPTASAKVLAAAANGHVCYLADGVTPEGQGWPWEALGLLDWHQDVAVVAPRLLDQHRCVVAGPDELDRKARLHCRHAGRKAHDSGPWGIATKPQTAGAVHPAFWIARLGAVRAVPEGVTVAAAGTWIGIVARERGERIAFCPFVVATQQKSLAGEAVRWSRRERQDLLTRLGAHA